MTHFANNKELSTPLATPRRDGWNLTRITNVRVVAQVFFLLLFLSFVILTTFANLDRLPRLRLWVSAFLQIDPLVSIATAVTTHTLYKGLLWSLVVLIPTFFLGRFFCNWVCPFGTVHQFVGRLSRPADPDKAIAANRYRSSQHVKYVLLTALLAAAAFGSLQIGWLDPVCLFYRSVSTALLPAPAMSLPDIFGGPRLYQGSLVIGAIVVALLAMNLVYPRFFCRVVCPLGALLGVLGRFAWWRIVRDPVACDGCNRCTLRCEGACDPHGSVRTAECLVCLNCIEDCPEGALRFGLFPSTEREVIGADIPRRKVVMGALAGVLFFPFARTSGSSTRNFSSQVIRPPGAVEELAFLSRCIQCDQCIRVCPTNVLQPAWFEAGLEGLWSPILNFRMGHCQLHCTACGHVCPTGAIEAISVEGKLGLGEAAAQGPVRIGTAHIDVGRCLPHSKNVACVVCQEVCPTSPKAIYTEPRRGGTGVPVEPREPDASTTELKVPWVDASLCIGCGICEKQCPVVGDRRAIYVTADGETRSMHQADPDRNRGMIATAAGSG